MCILWAHSSTGYVVILSGYFTACCCNIMMAFRHFSHIYYCQTFSLWMASHPLRQATEPKKNKQKLFVDTFCCTIGNSYRLYLERAGSVGMAAVCRLPTVLSVRSLCSTSRACVVQLAVSWTDEVGMFRGRTGVGLGKKLFPDAKVCLCVFFCFLFFFKKYL